MTTQVSSWPWIYEVSVDQLKKYWQSQQQNFPYLHSEYEFFIDFIPILREILPILTQKNQTVGRHPKSRPSQFFFCFIFYIFQKNQ